MNSALMRPVEYAAHRGVGKSAVSNWKKAGLLVYAEGEDGTPRIDVARTDARINAKVDPMRGRPRSTEASGLFSDANSSPTPARPETSPVADIRLDLMRAQVEEKRLKNAQTAGDLVPMAEAERLVGEISRAARDRMHSIVRTEAERLAAEREPRTIIAFMSEAIDRTFARLAEQFEEAEAEADESDADVEIPPDEPAEADELGVEE